MAVYRNYFNKKPSNPSNPSGLSLGELLGRRVTSEVTPPQDERVFFGSGSNYNDSGSQDGGFEFDRASSILGTTGAGRTQQERDELETAQARSGLEDTQREAELAVDRTGFFEKRQQQFEEELAKLGSVSADTTRLGVARSGSRAFLGAFLPDSWLDSAEKGALDALGKVAFAVGTPYRTLASWTKEASDILREGESPSFVEFVKQSVDPSFEPDVYPVEDLLSVVGLGSVADNDLVLALDDALNMFQRIAADPTTFFTGGQLKFAGQAGRAALADEVAKSLRASGASDDIVAHQVSQAYRYGEFGLDTRLRNQLNIEGRIDDAGIRWMGQVIPRTRLLQEGVAGSLARSRAKLGDEVGDLFTQMATPPERLGLTAIARGKDLTTDQTLAAFSTYEAAKFAQAESGTLVARLISDNREIFERFKDQRLRKAGSDGRSGWQQINDYMEGVSTEIDDDLLEAAGQLRTLYDQALEDVNGLRQLLNEQHGLNLPMVNRLDNYVHHTLSEEARRGWRTARVNSKASALWQQIKRELSITGSALDSKASFTVSRSKSKTFLGETLKDGSISDYNRIALKKLGYKLFEDDPALIMKAYLQSVGEQSRREFFVGRLLRTSPQSIKVFVKDARNTPDSARKVLNDAIDEVSSGVATLIKDIEISVEGSRVEMVDIVKSIRDDLTAQGTRAMNNKVAGRQRAEMRRKAKRLEELERQVEAVKVNAQVAGTAAQQDLDTVVDPLLARIRSLRAALSDDKTAYDNALEWLRLKHETVFPNATKRPTTAEGLADDILGDAQSRLSGAARKNVERKATEARAAAKTRNRTVEVDGVTMKVTDARREAKAAEVAVKRANSQYNNTIKNDPTLKQYRSLEAKRQRQAASFDVSAALVGAREEWDRTVGDLYRADIQTVKDLVNEAPKKGDSYELNLEWVAKVNDTLQSIQMLDVSDNHREILDRVFNQLFAEESRLAQLEASEGGLRMLMEAVKDFDKYLESGDWLPDLEDGWNAIVNLNVQVSEEVSDSIWMMYQDLDDGFLEQVATKKGLLEELRKPETHTWFAENFRTANTYFKTTALTTFGYTIRNILTGLWNNFAMGTTTDQMNRALRFAQDYNKVGLTQALANVEKESGAEAAEVMLNAFRSVQMSGGDRIIDEAVPRIGRAQVQYDGTVESLAKNVAVRGGDYIFRPFNGRLSAAARSYNEGKELWMRLSLGLNAVERGYSVMTSAARIARVQFDYTQLSELDESAKRFIPFWVFASRNLPLQMVQQVARRPMYSAYNKIVEEDVAAGYDDDLPSYRARRNPVRSPIGNFFLDFDLPFQSLDNTFGEYVTIGGILGQVTPVARSPIEYGTGYRQAFGETIPYSEDYRPAGLFDLHVLWKWEGGAEGQMVQDRFSEPIAGAMPAWANMRKYTVALLNLVENGRLFSGKTGEELDDPSASQRFFGGPLRDYERSPFNMLGTATGLGFYKPTERDLQKDINQQQYQYQKFIDKLRQLGYTE